MKRNQTSQKPAADPVEMYVVSYHTTGDNDEQIIHHAFFSKSEADALRERLDKLFIADVIDEPKVITARECTSSSRMIEDDIADLERQALEG